MKTPSVWPLARPILKLVASYEKLLLAILSVVVVISGGFWYRQFSKVDSTPLGGSYVEGIISNQEEIETLAARLTRTGLFRFNQTGELENQLVKSWQVNAEATEYRFQLIDEVDREQIENDLQTAVDLIGSIEAKLADNGDLVVTSEIANPNLALLLAQPIFNYGPYKVTKTNPKTTIFTRNPTPGAAEGHLNKIVLHSYDSELELKSALEKGKLDGALLGNGQTAPENYRLESLALPRYLGVILNVNKVPFRDRTTRLNLLTGASPVTSSFTLSVPDVPAHRRLAEALVSDWQAKGHKVSLQAVPAAEFKDKTLAGHDFQAALTGLDYGVEVDPYYLWHSSQVRTGNIAEYKSQSVDQATTAIRSSTNIAFRYQRLDELHQQLTTEGVLKIVEQEKIDLIISQRFNFRLGWLLHDPEDRFLAVMNWSER